MKGWVSAVALGGVALASASAAPAGDAPGRPGAAAGVQRQLGEANRAFTYRGEPINPRAVQELRVWIFDAEAGPVAIDLAGTHRTVIRFR